MQTLLTGPDLPPGYGTLNPFVAIKGSGGAQAFIRFLCEVFDAQETVAGHTVDADDLLIHAEVRIGDSTVMLCDSKPHWPFIPVLLQVYVHDLAPVIDRAKSCGAEVFTTPTAFHGHQRLARFQDAWHNLWWLFEYGPDSTAPSESPNELPSWKPDPAAAPSYVHQTIDAALTRLTRPGNDDRPAPTPNGGAIR
jgi:uncharacterized glyoxalase superfamily protein PhnB